MIGVYDYTVVLTYLSLISACGGIIVSLWGDGHPYIGMFCLLLSGLCDAFDGPVARTKKNRTARQENFGIQIDSLTDLVAFGVLPACIGGAMIRVSPGMHLLEQARPGVFWTLRVGMCAVLVLYVLAAMIRLAYFNVTEQERKQTETGTRKYYTGLPVTAAALIVPLVLLLQYLIPADLTPCYFLTIAITGAAFLMRFHIKKPGLRGVLILVGLGALEFVLILLCEVLIR